MMLNFNSYEDLKDKLQIRIYDPDFSRNLLEGKIVTYIGDFALIYMATLYESEKKLENLIFTQGSMDTLGIDIQTLHKDAMINDLTYEPILLKRLPLKNHCLRLIYSIEKYVCEVISYRC